MPFILKSTNDHPPGGFQYLESATGMLLENSGFSFVNMTTAIQSHRRNNPAYNLSVDYVECSWALEDYTCARLNNDQQWCMEISVEEFAARRTKHAPGGKSIQSGCPACPI